MDLVAGESDEIAASSRGIGIARRQASWSPALSEHLYDLFKEK
jgi:hypothetical protein